MQIEMCVYGEGTLRHKIVRYLIQMYIDVAGGITKILPLLCQNQGLLDR